MLQAAIGPILYLVFFLPAMSGVLGNIDYKDQSVDYLTFVLPGILVMNGFLLGQFAGIPIQVEKFTGELEVLFSLPLPRWKLLLSKTLGVAARTLVANAAILMIGLALSGSQMRLVHVGTIAGLVFSLLPAITWALIAIGLAVINLSEGAYNLILNVFAGPLFYASSIFYPLNKVPAWLQPLARVNPLTHATNLIRDLFLGINIVPIEDMLALFLFLIVCLCLAVPLFNRTIH